MAKCSEEVIKRSWRKAPREVKADVGGRLKPVPRAIVYALSANTGNLMNAESRAGKKNARNAEP